MVVVLGESYYRTQPFLGQHPQLLCSSTVVARDEFGAVWPHSASGNITRVGPTQNAICATTKLVEEEAQYRRTRNNTQTRTTLTASSSLKQQQLKPHITFKVSLAFHISHFFSVKIQQHDRNISIVLLSFHEILQQKEDRLIFRQDQSLESLKWVSYDRSRKMLYFNIQKQHSQKINAVLSHTFSSDTFVYAKCTQLCACKWHTQQIHATNYVIESGEQNNSVKVSQLHPIEYKIHCPSPIKWLLPPEL